MSARAIVLSVATLGYSTFIARTAFLVDGRLHVTLFDDAMISMTYARNLAEGHGLRWNAGEPAVEGFSNLLWTLVMAALHRLGLPDAWVSLPLMIVGALVLLAIVWLSARLGDILAGERDSRAGLYAAVLAAACYPLIYWTLRGMEVGLVALFTMLLLWALLDEGPRLQWRWGAAVLATMALTLTRDDGVVPVAAICGATLLAGDGSGTRRLALGCLGVLAAAKAAHLGWRYSYYGELVPNTYYLKLTGVSSMARAWAGLVAWLSVVLRQIGPLVVPAVMAVAGGGDRRLLIVSAPFAALSAYSISVGGDAWEYFNFANRYLTAGLPPLCVLAGLAIARQTSATVLAMALGVVMVAGGMWDLAEKVTLPYVATPTLAWGIGMILFGGILVGRAFRATSPVALTAGVLLTMVILIGNGRPYGRWLLQNAHAMENDTLVTRLGVAIRETTTEDASVAAYLAGSTPYFARRRSIDLFGKSDPHVARLEATSLHPGHNKVDLPYSLELEPDVVVTFAEAPPETRMQLEARGYVRLCAALWAREKSRAVDRVGLTRRCRSLEGES